MATGRCIGLDGVPCRSQCLGYWEDVAVSPPRCHECHHGKSRHCGAVTGTSATESIEVHGSGQSTTQSGSTPSSSDSSSTPQAAISESSSPIDKNLKSLEILKALVEGSSGAKPDGEAIEKARQESVSGFRPKAKVSFPLCPCTYYIENLQKDPKASETLSKKDAHSKKGPPSTGRVKQIIIYPFGLSVSSISHQELLYYLLDPFRPLQQSSLPFQLPMK